MKKLSLDELGRISVDDFKKMTKIPLVVVLDNIRSANNVGSFFRTSDAFGIEALFLCGVSAKPPHREISKTAIGADASVNWTYFENVVEAIQHLKDQNFIILGIEQTNESVDLDEFEISGDKKYAIVLGNEVSGISDEILPLLDASIEIMQYGTKHSLNVAVCGGICINHFAKALRLKE